MDCFKRPEDLEQQALTSLSSHQLQVFERCVELCQIGFEILRRVVQLKALYRNDSNIVPTETTFLVIGQYLLYLLASDRIGTTNDCSIVLYRSRLPHRTREHFDQGTIAQIHSVSSMLGTLFCEKFSRFSSSGT